MKTRPVIAIVCGLVVAVAGWLIVREFVGSRPAVKTGRQVAKAITRPPAVVKRPPHRRPPATKTFASAARDAMSDREARFIKSLMKGGPDMKLSALEIEKYLAQHGRSAANLLAAFQASNNDRYLKEAAAAFPNDPHVQFLVLSRNALPEERAKWIAAFQQAAPDNRLANFFAALDGFKNNQPADALQQMIAAAAKPSYDDYLFEQSAAAEALYAGAGWSPLEAKFAATFGLMMPQLSMMRDLSRELGVMEATAMAGGDMATAQTAASVGLGFARQVAEGTTMPTYVNELVGQAIERQFLSTADPAVIEQVLGQAAADRLAELDRQRNDIRQIANQWSARIEAGDLSAAELSEYLDLVRYVGEPEANRWLLSLKPSR